MTHTQESLSSLCDFIAEYASHLMAAGVHTSRVMRNSKRIAHAQSQTVFDHSDIVRLKLGTNT